MASRFSAVFLMTFFYMFKAQDLNIEFQGLVHRFRTLNNTLKTKVTGVQTDLAKLQSDVTSIQSSMNCVQSSIGSLQTTIGSLQTGVCSVPQQQNFSSLADDVTSMQDRIDSLQEQLETLNTTIQTRESTGIASDVSSSDELDAFDVALVTDPIASTVATDSIVKFNREFSNLRNGYNKDTGYYTAPASGLYNFMLAGRAAAGRAQLNLFHENGLTKATRVLCTIIMVDYNSASCGAIVTMGQGDKAYVKPHGSINILAGEWCDTKFTGFMMRRN